MRIWAFMCWSLWFLRAFNSWQLKKVQLRIPSENALCSFSWQERGEKRRKNYAVQQVAFELRSICVGNASLWVTQVLSRARTTKTSARSGNIRHRDENDVIKENKCRLFKLQEIFFRQKLVFLNLSAQRFGLHANERNIFTLTAFLWQVGNLCRFLFLVLLFL